MSSYSQTTYQSLIPTTQVWPQEFEDYRRIHDDKWIQMALSLNAKVIGTFASFPQATGKSYQNPTILEQRDSSYRIVLYGGPLPNAGVLTIPHGIQVTSNTVMLPLYGSATTPGTPADPPPAVTPVTGALFIPLPYINTLAPGDSVQLDADETNVYVTTTTANYVGYTKVVIVVEWLEQSS